MLCTVIDINTATIIYKTPSNEENTVLSIEAKVFQYFSAFTFHLYFYQLHLISDWLSMNIQTFRS
jgi:hypothetical protein